jgi:predicted peptidase
MFGFLHQQKTRVPVIASYIALCLILILIVGCATGTVSTAVPTQVSTTASSVSKTAVPSSATQSTTISSATSSGPTIGTMGGGQVNKSSDTVLQAMISAVAGKFRQFTYTDTQTGKTLPYNLYVPANYDPSKSYPLVLFMPDASVNGKETTAPLTQGYGAIIWATDAEQAKHPSFVLVPEYSVTVLDDHNGFVMTDYIDITFRLLNSITSQYNIDKNRLYTTGQSQGCMISLVLSTKYPDLFAAEWFVSGQWDITTLGNLAKQKFFYIAAEGDEKASGGQAEVKNMFTSAGVKYSTATWDATWSSDQFATAVKSILAEGNKINIATFKKGTVLPAGVAVGTSEHMYSFDYAYKIESVRDWLFAQVKTTN